LTKADEVRLFDVEQYTKPKHKHKRDWDGGVDPASEDGSAFPPLWKVGARIRVKISAELPQRKSYLNSNVGTVAAVNGFSTEVLFNESQNYEPHTVTLSNDCLELCPNPRDTSASLQESEDLSKELESPLEASPPSNSSNLTPTPKPSCARITPTSPSTATSGTFPPELENLNSLPADFLVSGQATPDCEQDSTTQSQACGLKPCGASLLASPASSSSKILQGLSVEDFEQFLEDCEWSDIVGMIHKSYQQRNWERRTKEKGFSSLPTPTTYAKGSGKCRPAGATRLEQSLRKFIAKGDKLHPAVPGWMMGFPPGWVEEILMAGGQAISIQLPFTPECVTIHQSAENATTSTPGQSAPSKQRSQSAASSTSKVCCPTCEQPLLNLADGCGVCGWMPNPPEPKSKIQSPIPPELKSKIQSSIPPELKSKIQSSIPPELKSKIQSSIPPELKSKIQSSIPPELSKKRSASGWLEHYTKNKKLKDGTIATFPRVEGHREPEEPSHWYWAYKYEEKTPIAKSANGFVTRAFSVPSSKVYSVRYAIASHWSISDILQLIKSC
jgi:hypothetical protein